MPIPDPRSPIPDPRSRLRSYLLLSRVSNLPTLWTNVLAGMCAAAVPLDLGAYVHVALAVSLFYAGGMFLNDAFDAPADRLARPERPIPAGDVPRREVFAVGGALLVVGELLLAPRMTAMLLGLALGAAIVAYDYRHKGSRVAPLVMGACRGLVYGIGAATVGVLTPTALAGAVAMLAYVAALTVVAKRAGAHARWLVPLLIAGISLADALFIAIVSSSAALALAAASGFALTLILQRWVPGD
jgi:4-hydroxybenzoate polyprenyltransferase